LDFAAGRPWCPLRQAAHAGLKRPRVLCADWRRAEATVTQAGDTAQVMADGDGDLDAVAA